MTGNRMMHDHEHARATLNGKRYLFTAKHHGGGSRGDARWLPDLSEDDEFAVFETADRLEVQDVTGNLYGVQPIEDGLRYLGTFGQQVAYFPLASAGSPWHGYPLWPLNSEAAPNRRGNRYKAPDEIYDKMVEVGLISIRMRKVLKRGDFV